MICMQRTFLPNCIMIVMMAIIIPNVCTGAVGTIMTITDDEFTNINYDVDYDRKLIIFEFDGRKKSIGFHRIEQILDENNLDVTAEVLGETENRKKNLWQSKYQMKRRKSILRPWNVGIGFNLDFSVPLGTYFDGIDGGAGFGLDLLIAVDDNIDIKFNVSKSGLRLPAVWNPIKFSAWRYYLAIQYHNDVYEMRPGIAIWYGYIGLGAVTSKFDVSGYPNLYSETKFSLGEGGGVNVLLSKNLALDIGIMIDLMFIGAGTTYYGTYESQKALILDFKIGLVNYF